MPHPQFQAKTQIGHIHLTVSDLDRSLAFYRNLLGFEITTWYGKSAVFLSAAGFHHHIGINTWAGKGASSPPLDHTGLFHFAILYPDRKELAKPLKRLMEADYPLQGASDHGVSEAIYLSDPDGNGVELYSDRNPDSWPRDAQGNLNMFTHPLELEFLLSELEKE
ncbi:VOC family protein [candidate division TA06 bacterium]|nr:VOC family protein [candidate division TA06 bacterium]